MVLGGAVLFPQHTVTAKQGCHDFHQQGNDKQIAHDNDGGCEMERNALEAYARTRLSVHLFASVSIRDGAIRSMTDEQLLHYVTGQWFLSVGMYGYELTHKRLIEPLIVA